MFVSAPLLPNTAMAGRTGPWALKSYDNSLGSRGRCCPYRSLSHFSGA